VKHLSWIVTLPLLAVAVIFAVNHRSVVTLDLWPLPIQLEAALYFVVLLAIFLGFLVGGAVMWLSQHRVRRRMRAERQRARELERDVETLQRRLDQYEGPGAGRMGSPETRGRMRLRPPTAPSLPALRR